MNRLYRVSGGRALLALFGMMLAGGALAPPAIGQVLYGSIVGTVKDATGGVLPGATVTITQKETKATREAVTDAAGAYRFPTLQPGTYSVVVTMSGFRNFTRDDVPVTLNTVSRVEAALSVSQLSESVTVSAEHAVLQTDRAEVREELRSRELTDLPVPLGRNYQELFQDVSGVHAAGRRSLSPVEPVARAHVQRQWSQQPGQQHANRWRELY